MDGVRREVDDVSIGLLAVSISIGAEGDDDLAVEVVILDM